MTLTLGTSQLKRQGINTYPTDVKPWGSCKGANSHVITDYSTMKIERRGFQLMVYVLFVACSLVFYIFTSRVSYGFTWNRNFKDPNLIDPQQYCDSDFILDVKSQNNKNNRSFSECQGFNQSFESSIKENMRYISHYEFNVSSVFLKQLQLNKEGIKQLTTQTMSGAKIPTFVTAVSENHYREFMGFLRVMNRIKKTKYPELKLLVYDIGLSPNHAALIQKMCKCSVRKFPFEIYPKHVRHLRGFAWKPIIIQSVLQEFDFVMWMDTSIRLKNVHPYFQKAKRYGIQVIQGGGSISARTHRRLFDTLRENQCLFNYPEVKGGLLLIARSCLTLTYIMRPWVSCALQYGCMDFKNAERYDYCNKSLWKLSSCHRFDQSVLGIILTRLFNNRRHYVIAGKDFADVCRRCY